MNDPIAMTVHPGGGLPPTWRRELIAEWLRANGIDPDSVGPEDPIHVLTIPYEAATDDGPWFIKVILFTQHYVKPDGRKEANLLTREVVRFQRTVPLTTPFPADPTPGSEGTPTHGQEPEVQPVQEGQRPPQHEGGPQEDEQQAVRAAAREEVQDR